MTHNSERYVEGGESRLKVRHLNNDRDAFDEMNTSTMSIEQIADLLAETING